MNEIEGRIRDTLRRVSESMHESSDLLPAYTSRPARARSPRLALVLAGVGAGLLVAASGALIVMRSTNPDRGVATTPAVDGVFSVRVSPSTVAPHETLQVSGSGCPPSGPLETPDGPVVLRFTQVLGGNSLEPTLVGGHVEFPIDQMLVFGEVDLTIVPNSDGRFEAAISIPADARKESVYVVRGLCQTLLRVEGQQFDAESLERSTAVSAEITVR